MNRRMLSVSLQVDEKTRQLLTDNSTDAGDNIRGRAERMVAGVPQLARAEARVDVSPGRRSVSYESIQSSMSLRARDGAAIPKREMDEQELMPDYSRLPAGRPQLVDEGPAATPGDHLQVMMSPNGGNDESDAAGSTGSDVKSKCAGGIKTRAS